MGSATIRAKGGTVSPTLDADSLITTAGDPSYGIFAQSTGLLVADTVTVQQTGDELTIGNGSTAIFAQSAGGTGA